MSQMSKSARKQYSGEDLTRQIPRQLEKLFTAKNWTEPPKNAASPASVAGLTLVRPVAGGGVQAFGGEVLKFIGDGVLAIFPIGERNPSAACDAALRAIAAARVGMVHLDAARGEQGLSPPSLRHGLHLGKMLWGNICTADRLDFTAIGSAVNLVVRLERACADRSVAAS